MNYIHSLDLWQLLTLVGFCVSSLLLIWQFAGYPFVMGLVGLTDGSRRTVAADLSELPFVTVIVPSYNEVDVIERQARNMAAQSYPADRFEILFVDSGSTDGTADAVVDTTDSLEPPAPKMELLVEGQRNRKTSTINVGIDRADGEIIVADPRHPCRSRRSSIVDFERIHSFNCQGLL